MIKHKSYLTFGFLILLSNLELSAQIKQVSLDSSFVWAEQSFPLTRQRSLNEQAKDYSLENVNRSVWPQIAVVGQATYQSDVTQLSVPIPGFTPTEMSKDQYKLYGEVNQSLTDLFTNKHQKARIHAESQADYQKNEVDLYAVKQRVQQIYFGILLLQEQIKQLRITQSDLENAFATTKSAVENGVAIPGAEDVLKADILNIKQKEIELNAALEAYKAMLASFINKKIDAETAFETPNSLMLSSEIHRPELALFASQQHMLSAQSSILKTKTYPRFNLFLQSGLGRPALNMLDNDMAFYYIGGLRLQWNLSSYYTQSKEQKVIGIQQSKIESQKEAFVFNTQLQLTQQSIEMEKWQQLILVDKEQLSLREKIKQTASTQLEQGTITSTEYISHVHAEESTRQNLVVHELQWLMAQYTQKLTSGN
ncbi:TolC family protein [bacterium]|nr:MAG: TolC family protein [bacterium]